MRAGRTLSPDEFWARMRAHDDELRGMFATRPTYALANWSGQRMIDEWSFGDSTFRSVRFDDEDDGQFVVATADERDDEPARHLLLNLPTTDPERMTDEAKSLAHFERSQRPADASVLFVVSGAAVAFDAWIGDGYTVAGAFADGVAIAVRTTGTPRDGLALIRIDDIEPYIRGRNDRIRAMRAERGLDD
jgi:hypothetical protein